MQTCGIKSIKHIQVPLQSVYDITTEHNHNFILKNGSVLHNCDTGQTLKAKGYPYEVLSVDRVDTDKICKPYQYFKNTIYDKRIELFENKLLFREITDLERNIDTGKVDHPQDSSKDTSDAVCGAVFNASKHAEEFAYDYGENMEIMLQLNNDNFDDVKQLTLDLEEELKKMQRVNMLNSTTKPTHPSNVFNKTSDYYLLDDDIIII